MLHVFLSDSIRMRAPHLMSIGALLLAGTACTGIQTRESFWHPTRTSEVAEIDFLKCKQANSGANLTSPEQLTLAKDCMRQKGYEILPTKEALRRDGELAKVKRP